MIPNQHRSHICLIEFKKIENKYLRIAAQKLIESLLKRISAFLQVKVLWTKY